MSPEQRANLTAYLDGELDETETADIETMLAKSAVARNDVELLARTYDLLDQLPRFEATAAFTERTIATIRLETADRDYTQAGWYQIARRSVRPLLLCVMLIAASSIGYLIAQSGISNDADMLARDYEVIGRLDDYQDVGSAEFLRVLQQHPELMDEIEEQSHAQARR